MGMCLLHFIKFPSNFDTDEFIMGTELLWPNIIICRCKLRIICQCHGYI